jgi:hypothetical protein
MEIVTELGYDIDPVSGILKSGNWVVYSKYNFIKYPQKSFEGNIISIHEANWEKKDLIMLSVKGDVKLIGRHIWNAFDDTFNMSYKGNLYKMDCYCTMAEIDGEIFIIKATYINNKSVDRIFKSTPICTVPFDGVYIMPLSLEIVKVNDNNYIFIERPNDRYPFIVTFGDGYHIVGVDTNIITLIHNQNEIKCIWVYDGSHEPNLIDIKSTSIIDVKKNKVNVNISETEITYSCGEFNLIYAIK